MRINLWVTFRELLYLIVALVFYLVFFSSRITTPPQLFIHYFVILVALFMFFSFLIPKLYRLLCARDGYAIRIKVYQLVLISLLCSIGYFSFLYVLYHPGLTLTSSLRPLASIALNTSLLILLYAALTLVAYSAGAMILKKFRVTGSIDAALENLSSIGIGFGCIILLYYLLALSNLISIGLVVLGTYAGIMLVVRWRDFARLMNHRLGFTLRPLDKNTAFETAVVLLCTAGSVFALSLYTSTSASGDATRTYLNLPLTFLQYNGYVPFPHEPLNQSPLITTYLLLPLMQISPASVSIFGGYTFIVSAILILRVALIHFSIRASLIGLLLFLVSTTNIHYFSTVARPDGLLLFFVSLCIGLLITVKKISSARLLALTGVLFGIAIGIKYNALYALPALILIIGIKTGSITAKTKGIVTMLLFSVLAFSPWWTANLIRYQNPLHPFWKTNLYSYYESDRADNPLFKQSAAEFNVFTRSIIGETSSALQKLALVSLAGPAWPTNNLGPIVLLVLLALALQKGSKLIYTLFAAAALVYAMWHFSQINQLHFIHFMVPWIILILGYCLDRFKNQHIVGMIILFGLCEFFIHPDLQRSIIKGWTDMAVPQHNFIFSSRGLFTHEATLIDWLRYQNRDYLLLPLLPTNELNTLEITDNWKHVVSNYGYSYLLDLVIRSQTNQEMLNLIKKRGITHFFIPNIQGSLEQGYPLIAASCTEKLCPLMTYLNQRVNNLLPELRLLISAPNGNIYEVPE